MNWKILNEEIVRLKVTVIVVVFMWAFTHCKESAASGCPANFHGNCICDKRPYDSESNSFVVNCTDTDLDNANILEHMPVDTEVLIYTGNNVIDLPLNIFGNYATYEYLKVIDLSNNHIQTIKGKTFHGVGNVRVLILNDNNIYLVGKDDHPRMFSNFKNLEELHLRNAFTKELTSNDYIRNLEEIFVQSQLNHLRVLNLEKNEISSFPDQNFFCSLPYLQDLRLSDNRLIQFNLNIKCLPYLNVLDLSQNYISYFNNDTLTAFELHPHLKINLTDNPFRCDCNMINMFQWMIRTRNKLMSIDSYSCKDGFPPQNIGRLLSNLTRDDLQCRLFVHDFDNHLNTVYVILTLIIVAMILLIITIIIYKNKAFVYDKAFRMSVNIRRKFQYDSLDKTEETEMEV